MTPNNVADTSGGKRSSTLHRLWMPPADPPITTTLRMTPLGTAPARHLGFLFGWRPRYFPPFAFMMPLTFSILPPLTAVVNPANHPRTTPPLLGRQPPITS